MKKVFIHIGLQKTGSTFLQKSIFPNIEGIQYVSRPFTQYNHEFNKMQYADDSLFDQLAFNDELDSVLGSKTLFSDENFAGKIFGYSYINRSMIAHRLAEATKQYDTTVILFIRNQRDILKSLYNQWVKGHLNGDRPINELFWHSDLNFTKDHLVEHGNGNEAMSLNHLYYNTNKYYVNMDSFLYSSLVDLYKKNFSNVHVLLYEDFITDPSYTYDKLSSILGCEISNPKISKSTYVNKSIDESELFKRTIINSHISFFRQFPRFKRLVNVYVRLNKEKRNRFYEDYEQFLSTSLEFYKQDNELLAIKHPEIGLERFSSKYHIDK